MSNRKPEVAVIGSGIAGLATTWFLGNHCQVTLYEKHASLGIDAFARVHSANGQDARIDLPYRVIKGDFYVNLIELYREAGIELRRLDYAFTMSNFARATYFGYKNMSLFGMYFPMIKMLSVKNRENRALLAEMLRFYRYGLRQNPQDLTMDAFLTKHKFSEEFRDRFLYPIYSTINTCSMKSAGRYPASSYIEYHTGGTKVGGVYHTANGTIDAATRLAARAHKIRLKDPVDSVGKTSGGRVQVLSAKGRNEYDHVVIASQANQAATFLSTQAAEVTSLKKISYETSEIYTHTDERYMPARRGHWEPVSFIVSDEHERPAATLWLNRLEPSLRNFPDTFQSWNPLFQTAPRDIINIARFERPVLDFKALEGVRELHEMAKKNPGSIHLCGSYNVPGVPLLEAGVKSARRVADRILNQMNNNSKG